MILLLLCVTGCSNKIKSLYEQERANATITLTQTPENWKPDLRLRISYNVLNKIGMDALQNRIKSTSIKHTFFGREINLKSEGEVLQFRVEDTKDHSFVFSTRIRGNLALDTDLIQKNIPYSVALKGKIELYEREGTILGKIKTVEKLTFTGKSTPQFDLTQLLRGWLEEDIPKIEEMEIAQLDLQNLHVRAVRIESGSKSANINLLSNVNGARPIRDEDAGITSAWDLELSQTLLKGWVRRAAYEQGILSNGIAIDPRSIQISDQQFNLGLRLWKLEGGQWWRDYDVTGEISIQDSQLHLQGNEVSEVAQSEWAGFADPLALLAEGFILETIKKQINYALPSQKSANLQGKTLLAELKSVQGKGSQLKLMGSFEEVEEGSKVPTLKKDRKKGLFNR